MLRHPESSLHLLPMTVAVGSVDSTVIECRMLAELSVSGGRVLTHDELLRRV